jgi:hypothetical protein
LLLLRSALLALLAALGVGLLSSLAALAARLIRSPLALAGAGTLALAALIALLRGAGTLLPLAQFLLHEAALLRLGARPRRVESAVRAALPTFRVSLLAMRADDALWQRHFEVVQQSILSAAKDLVPIAKDKSARIVHFAPCRKTRAARRCRR